MTDLRYEPHEKFVAVFGENGARLRTITHNEWAAEIFEAHASFFDRQADAARKTDVAQFYPVLHDFEEQAEMMRRFTAHYREVDRNK